LNHSEIRKAVARVIDKLPKEFREQLRNVEIVVETRPSKELLLAEGLDPREIRCTASKGVPLPDRSALDPPLLPTRLPYLPSRCWKIFPIRSSCARKSA
jgi:predicted Zn-dependent protease with MMP-like domain